MMRTSVFSIDFSALISPPFSGNPNAEEFEEVADPRGQR
jgi:hypothetical protein